jgi:hypothetical protein
VQRGGYDLSDKRGLWELPHEGDMLYVLVAARRTISALVETAPDGILSSAEDISECLANIAPPRRLMDKVPAACLISGGRVVSRVKDLDHALVLRRKSASEWEEDGLGHYFAGTTVNVAESGGRAVRVKLAKGLMRVDFLPVGARKERQRIGALAARPHRAGAYELSKKLVLAALSFVFLLFGPAIRERLDPVIAPVAERVPEMHSRGELYLVS